jgi:hypothetical protein
VQELLVVATPSSKPLPLRLLGLALLGLQRLSIWLLVVGVVEELYMEVVVAQEVLEPHLDSPLLLEQTTP